MEIYNLIKELAPIAVIGNIFFSIWMYYNFHRKVFSFQQSSQDAKVLPEIIKSYIDFEIDGGLILNEKVFTSLKTAKVEAIKIYEKSPENWRYLSTQLASDSASKDDRKQFGANLYAWNVSRILDTVGYTAMVGGISISSIFNTIGIAILEDWALSIGFVKYIRKEKEKSSYTPHLRKNAEWLALACIIYAKQRNPSSNFLKYLMEEYNFKIEDEFQKLSKNDSRIISEKTKEEISKYLKIRI